MLKSVLSAAVLSLMACSIAWAVPAVSSGTELTQTSSDLLKVGRGDHDKDHNKWQRGWRGPHAFDDDHGWRGPDRRYRHPSTPIVRTIGRTEAASTSAPSGIVHSPLPQITRNRASTSAGAFASRLWELTVKMEAQPILLTRRSFRCSL
jgi:hypothetical protein